jgi:formylglycine-generating enzyme required for sulfatase activity
MRRLRFLLAATPLVLIAQPPAFVNSSGMEFVLIPAGGFLFGKFSPTCAPGEHLARCQQQALRDSRPGRQVSFPAPFYLGKFEVTQQQWERVMGSNPSHFRKPGGGGRPVENVAWNQVQQFLRRLNSIERTHHYRLPSEAEWEYAARATEQTDRPAGKLDEIAWHGNNSASETRAVGQKRPNAWGLHDMLGNVWEWVQDAYAPETGASRQSGKQHVLKGGSFQSHEKNLQFSSHAGGPGDPLAIGFRVLMEVR